MDLINALANRAAHVCQYGRAVTLTADPDAEPCRGWADQLLDITTDDGPLMFCVCGDHARQIRQLTRAEDLTTLTTEATA